MGRFNIFERNRRCHSRTRRLSYVGQVAALDAFDAVRCYCGENASQDYVAMPEGWRGTKTWQITNQGAMPAPAC